MGCFMAFATAYRRWLERLACAVDDLRAQKRTFDNEIRKQEMLQGQVRGEGVKIMSDRVKRLEKLIQKLPLIEHKRTSLFSNIVNFIRHAPTIYKIKEAVVEAEVLAKVFEDMDKQDIKRLLQSYTDEKIFDIWVDYKRRLLSLQCLLKLVKDENSGTVPVIGIHGIGGVGKTALMRKLHDAEMSTLPGQPDTVIEWIDVSMDCNIDHIQGKIADVLNLKKKRCILFLDDVWDALVFENIRKLISDYSEHHQKTIVIFTTRNSQLCLNMNARILQVPLLDETESRELLKKHLGADAQIPETGLPIMSILCDGLPLAIEVLAREVIGKKLISVRDLLEDWNLGNNTLLVLRLSTKVADARDILGEFRYRFGSLTDEEISCLLYCSIIDLETVTLEDIVNQLVAEEKLPLLSSSLCTSKEEMHAIMKRLELMSLLQRYGNDRGEHLKMHNFIREVLSLEYHRESLSIKSPNASPYLNWETAKRLEISLQDAEKLLDTPHLYLNLHSLVINQRSTTDVVTKISRTVFTCMPALLVLDLSHTKITVLPETIRCLTELQYLSLSYTELKSFPLELRYLKKLRQLYLRATSALNFIPRDSFCGFLRLQALDFVASQYWENQGNNDPSQLKFEDFKNMHYLEEFGITITDEVSLDKLLELNKLCQVTTSLVLRFIDDQGKFLQVLKIMSKLKKFQIESSRLCSEIHIRDEQLVCLEELGLKNCDFSAIVIGESSFEKVHHLTISNCNNLCDIEWARFAPQLKYIDISSCDRMIKLFECQTTDIIRLSNLESLKLSCMSRLKIICSGSLAVPSLQELKIDVCGELEEHQVHKNCWESPKPINSKAEYVWQATTDDMLLPTDIRISLSSNDRSTLHGNSEDKNKAASEIASETEAKSSESACSSWTTSKTEGTPGQWEAGTDYPKTRAAEEDTQSAKPDNPETRAAEENTSSAKPEYPETSATQKFDPVEESEAELEETTSAKSDNPETSATQESNTAEESESPEVEDTSDAKPDNRVASTTQESYPAEVEEATSAKSDNPETNATQESNTTKESVSPELEDKSAPKSDNLVASTTHEAYPTEAEDTPSAKSDKPETSATHESNTAEESESPEVEDTSAAKLDNPVASTTQESYPAEPDNPVTTTTRESYPAEVENTPSAKLDKPETSATHESNTAEESESPEVEDKSAAKPDNPEISTTQESNAGCTPNQEVMAVKEKTKIENMCPLKSKDLDYSVRSEIETLSLSKAEDTQLSGAKGAAKNDSFEKAVEFIQNLVNQDKSEASKSKSQDKGFLLQSIKDQRNSVWVDKKGRLSKLSRLVNNETIKRDQTIGILGMVGVGKTALMGQLYHDLVKDVEKTQNYVSANTVTLWIQVSTYSNVIGIQDQIAKVLKLDFGGNDDVQSRASIIFCALSLKNKRILFLDDVTNALDFKGVGIPYRNDDKQQAGSTVLIFTTRYSQVCIDMKAQVYKVPFLDEKESCELFEKHLGTKEELQLKPLQPEKLNQECDGLPLAIVLLAEEVKKRSTDKLNADKPSFLSFKELYDNSPDAMKDAVAAVKRDFCILEDEEISCIRYCSLLGDVEVEKCLNMLVGEGSLPDLPLTFSVDKEKKMATIKKLENLNFLRRYLLSWNTEHMQIHNFVKEVILMDDHPNHVTVNSTDESLLGNWVSATRVKISLRDGEELLEDPQTKTLRSLLMRIDDEVHDCFFGGMQSLTVLDLSHSAITFLPESVTSLEGLHYLNLSNTKIELLPEELVNLKKLRQLYLRSTSSLESVPKDAIVELARLQVLDFFSSAFRFQKSQLDSSSLDLIDLQTMDFLEEFSVTITEVASFGRLLTLDQLCQATMSLALKNINDEDLFSQAFKALSKIKNLTVTLSDPATINICAGQLVSLEKLSFTSCKISMIVCDVNCMKESSMAPFQALWHLTISGCSELQDVSWIRFAPSLKCLLVSVCPAIKELVKHGDNDQDKEQFSKIEFLKLALNPSLEVIYKGSLSLPSLRELEIYQCPHFKEHLFREKGTDDPKTITGKISHHWTANVDDLLLKNISPSIYHLFNDSPTSRPGKASEVPHETSKSGFVLAEPAGASQLTEHGTSKSIDDNIGKYGFVLAEPAGASQLTESGFVVAQTYQLIEPGTSKFIDDNIGKSGFVLAEPAGASQLTEPGTSKSIDNNIGKSGIDMTKPCTSQSRDDKGMSLELESADNEVNRFRRRWLESPDDKEMETPLETSSVWIDHKDRLHKLEKLVGDESINREQIIGILGMMGVGKTTLMRRLYEEMTRNYDISESLVAWIQVSADPSVRRIEEQIGKALNLKLKRCILFLDDVAEAVDFEWVGNSAYNGHEMKRVFIFTTRYSQVCVDMNARIFEVPLLDIEESYELFKRHLSVSVDGSYEVKNKLQEECDGLPLAIQLLAREAEKKSTNISCDSDLSFTEMYHVNPDALNGAITAIFKCTHGRLTDEDISCLIYHSLVSDLDHEICISALVGKDIKPDPSSSLSTAKEDMKSRIKKLESMSLLQTADRIRQLSIFYPHKGSNKMHNFIKQTITMGCHPDHVTVASATECQLESWEQARCVRISLLQPCKILPDVSPICSKLHSLIIGSGGSGSVFKGRVGIPTNFFTQMPILRVLDLSGTDISILPNIVKDLLKLQYLNLSSTHIKSLPEKLGNLTNLRQLYLKHTHWLENVPRDAFSGLAKLQSLHFIGSCFDFKKSETYLPQLELKDLEGMHQLEEFSATISFDETFLRGLLTSSRLRKATVSLELRFIEDDGGLVSQALETLSEMKEFSIYFVRVRMIRLSAGKQVSLEKLVLESCNSFSKIDAGDATCLREPPPSTAPFHALLHLEIRACPEVRDISWVQLAPSLRYLTVEGCHVLRELVVRNCSAPEIEPWSQLQYVELTNNKNLEIIYSGSFSLPSLIRASISFCPKLREHHFQTNSTAGANKVIDNIYWLWTADPDDLLLPKNIRPTVSYLSDDGCDLMEEATLSEQLQSEGMWSSKLKNAEEVSEDESRRSQLARE